ncbi:hypothetical protein ASPZODRAFT_129847 [Penicilliopsis zonata CBS 506.65]|uniref:Uncharacterized protein n=1 Tax=Penicilliopsis zonata CBS 506.65 TaxID=1073090 RepID=A0A1L9SQ63_9EURO|nr:hypothetical protein ASPZODRAFT_129847 [Penicilliopsis zonata CBS 506.65]OJJ49392.1 hypothetical protein ASPZODRAFT_129847 [Penicilliopsis zonata CBS 506.65]
MPPRLRVPSERVSQLFLRPRVLCQYEASTICRRSVSAAAASAVAPAASIELAKAPNASISKYPQSQPHSYRRPENRRSQLLRQYASLIRTSPLMVMFQHNNLKAVEWLAIRRELNKALQKVDEQMAAEGRNVPPIASNIKLQIIRTSIFDVALRVVEYFKPIKTPGSEHWSDGTSTPHDLSHEVHDAVFPMKGKHELSAILLGPVAVLSIPVVSPEYMKAALSVLVPKDLGLTPPSRKANPTWHEPTVQNGLQKLTLLAARVDGKLLDTDETVWVSKIEGGMDGLRAQLVRSLESVGASVTSALEGAGKSLYLTLESRRSVLEEEQKGPADEKSEP